MFRMNGISRVSTWMCGAIVSNLHKVHGCAARLCQFCTAYTNVRRDRVDFARLAGSFPGLISSISGLMLSYFKLQGGGA